LASFPPGLSPTIFCEYFTHEERRIRGDKENYSE